MGWTRTARRPPARKRWRVRASRSRRAGGRDDEGFVRELREFIDRTGIAVEFAPDEARTVLDFEPDEPGRRPDVFVGSAIPAWVAGPCDRHRRVRRPRDAAIRLRRVPAQRRNGDRRWRRALPADGGVLAIPLDVDLKGLVFYPKAEFREAGYEIPNTWDELVALSHQIVADGRTPWCFAFDSGPGSGWPGTDFIESLVMRVGGVDTYDAWTAGEVGFTSPAVMEAGRLADDLIFEPGFVRDGPATISQTWYESPLSSMLAINEETGEKTEPECWLYHQADFMLQLASSGRPGRFGHRFLHASADRSESADSRDRSRDLRIGAGRHARGSGLHGVRRQSGVGGALGRPIATAASRPPTSGSMPLPTVTPTSIPRSRSEQGWRRWPRPRWHPGCSDSTPPI